MQKSEILEFLNLYSQNPEEWVDFLHLNANRIFAEDLLLLLTPEAVQKFRQAVIYIASIYEGIESDLEESLKTFSTNPNKDKVLEEMKRTGTVNLEFPEHSFAYHKIQKIYKSSLVDIVCSLYLIPINRKKL
ncbi:MAG: hypothetical protein L3J07_04395 [Candidatus Magasanikbacteria bacterium]|nr:hypothetical protein [Candidatus Magasanikbacteria bacterium]